MKHVRFFKGEMQGKFSNTVLFFKTIFLPYIYFNFFVIKNLNKILPLSEHKTDLSFQQWLVTQTRLRKMIKCPTNRKTAIDKYFFFNQMFCYILCVGFSSTYQWGCRLHLTEYPSPHPPLQSLKENLRWLLKAWKMWKALSRAGVWLVCSEHL